MWRIGLVLVLASVSFENVSAEIQDQLVQRIKRSYDCPPFYPPYPEQPHLPPPPFWPPPPHPYWRHHHHDNYDEGYNRGYNQAETQGNPQSQEGISQAQSQALTEEGRNAKQQENEIQFPCETCGGSQGSHGSNAISNAKSNTGSAVAIAIARSKNK